jgi:hypothetical protein
MTQTEALKLALEALKKSHPYSNTDKDLDKHSETITAIKAALEANEFNPDWDTQAVLVEEIQRMAKRIEELEAQRTWVGLTNDELTDLFYNKNLGQESAVGQAIALLKERNT